MIYFGGQDEISEPLRIMYELGCSVLIDVRGDSAPEFLEDPLSKTMLRDAAADKMYAYYDYSEKLGASKVESKYQTSRGTLKIQLFSQSTHFQAVMNRIAAMNKRIFFYTQTAAPENSLSGLLYGPYLASRGQNIGYLHCLDGQYIIEYHERYMHRIMDRYCPEIDQLVLMDGAGKKLTDAERKAEALKKLIKEWR